MVGSSKKQTGRWAGILAFLMAGAAFAEQPDPQEVVRVQSEELVAQIQVADLGEPAQRALNHLVAVGLEKLREKGLAAEAEAYGRQWELLYSQELTQVRVMDLGDHRPMFQWLADFYFRLETTLGKLVCRLTHLDDIPVFNYGIPVVFMPKGDRDIGETWDKEEYRRHFVPFASAVAYWTARVACSAALTLPVSLACAPAAEIPRWGMYWFIAPPISDHIYDWAHH